ncbi:MAG: hypothetical protein JXA25_02805 [Anaerolineales bacterium]|nr:hypothetical protein [Anaerolineales bacterium]
MKILLPAAGFLSGLFLTLLFLVLLPKIFSLKGTTSSAGYTATVIPYVFTKPQQTETQETPTTAGSQLDLNIVKYTAGDSVIVSHTEGQGLRLREYPSLGSQMLFLAQEGDLYIVVGGPSDADGYRWWYLENQQDTAQRGWGVEEFLEQINE